MRMKFVIAGLAALLVSEGAMAQGGGGQQPRPQRQPEPDVAPIRVERAAVPMLSAIPPALVPENTWVLDLSDGGRVSVQLRPDQAPQHVERIKALTRRGFYNNLVFHRVIEGFMAQGGDPGGTGAGQSDLPDLSAEFNALPHLRGAVAMARTGDNVNSANSQFYIMFAPRLSMDREYTVFGRVVGGMQYVDGIQRGQPPATPTRIIRASIGADNVPPPTAEEIAAANRVVAPAAPAQLPVLDVRSLGGTPSPARAPQPGPAPAPAPTPQN